MLAPYWLFVLGGLFVAVTLFLPRGIVGTVQHWLAQRRERRRAKAARRGRAAGRPTPRRGRRSETPWTRRTTDGAALSRRRHRLVRRLPALNNLSLTVEPGEMRAIIGPNGAGKTTMMDVVTGKTRPDDGDVFFDGTHDLTALDETEIAELGIGRKFQKPTVFEIHTVEDNLVLALKSDRRAARDAVLARDRRGRRAASTRSSRSSGCRRCASASPAACRTARSSGSRSACCWRRSRSCCWSTSRSPA